MQVTEETMQTYDLSKFAMHCLMAQLVWKFLLITQHKVFLYKHELRVKQKKVGRPNRERQMDKCYNPLVCQPNFTPRWGCV